MIITIIGNKTDPNRDAPADGGRVRVNLYERILSAEGHKIHFIDLEGWKKKIPSLISKVKKAVNNSDVVLIMGGPRGARMLIYLCNFFNKNNKTRIVYSILGVGTIDEKIKNLTPEDAQSFLRGEETYNISDNKMGKALSKLDLVLAQNSVIANIYKNFYKLDNVKVMENFRDFSNRPNLNLFSGFSNNKVRFVYYSRINNSKGIFDILNAFKNLKEKNFYKEKWSLDIIGDLQLNDEEKAIFTSSLDNHIKYNGVINNEEVLNVLNKYDFLIFPTKYRGEGTPGAIIESFLAGTPVLSSRYSQATELIDDGHNGLIFELNNVDSLTEKIKYIISLSTKELNEYKKRAYTSGEKFTYSYNRERFLSYITGNEVE